MAQNLNAFNDADTEVLRQLIRREKANYSANVRSLAPVPRKKIEWKASATIKWFHLQGNAYANSDYSPYSNAVWQTTGRECEWNDTTKQWDAIFPYVEHTVYSSSGAIAAFRDQVVPCQKTSGGGYEVISSAPPLPVSYSQDNSQWTNGDFEYVSSNPQLRNGSTSPADKSGWLLFGGVHKTNAYPYGINERPVHYYDATAPSTNGTFDVNFTAVYEVRLQIRLTKYLYATGTNPRRQLITGTTGAASAGTAHTHTYQYFDPYTTDDSALHLRAELWRKPSGGSYAKVDSSSWWAFPDDYFSMVDNKTGEVYNGSMVALLNEGDRIGIKVVSEGMHTAGLTFNDYSVSFWPMTLGFAERGSA